jgi:hypothetical protein
MKARTHALRFRIWQYCQPREWNVTNAEIAEGIGEEVNRVRATIQHAGWSDRIRTVAVDDYGPNGFHLFGTAAAAAIISEEVIAGRINAEAEI